LRHGTELRASVDLHGWNLSLARMNSPAFKVLRALMDAFAREHGHATVRMVGGARGYALVAPEYADPRGAAGPHLVVELAHGTVRVTDALAQALGARMLDGVAPTDDAHGASTHAARLRWKVTYSGILEHWGSEHAFADAVVHGLFRQGGHG
jgi:hypothetical protein